MRFIVIGLDDNREQYFAPDVLQYIGNGKVFSGGLRHHEIVKHYLPIGAEWINITVPLDKVFEQYQSYNEIIVFASGDPLFFGFANTIKRKLPEAEIILFPTFNSLQTLAHRMILPYQNMHIVSLTGRPWQAFDEALIEGKELMGLLTDREKTPVTIAERMLEYGYDNYRMTVGELLGNKDKENIRSLSLTEVIKENFQFPNCIILERTSVRPRLFGIPESEFHLLNGRAKMITKMPIRLITLSMLDLRNKNVFWDIGFCTGSVSIEAKMQFPYLQIFSFEEREEGRELIEMNCRKFGTLGITPFIGDFLETDISSLPRPDAVFIGGHGGKMIEMVQKIKEVLLPNGTIVFNSVSRESKEMFLNAIQQTGMKLTQHMNMTVDEFNPIEIMKATL